MVTAEKLREIAERQRALLSELDSEVTLFDEFDPIKERKRLEAELQKNTVELEEAKRKLRAIGDENAGLKARLYEQIYSEKSKLLDNAAQKLDVYFHAGVADEQNELVKLESSVKARIESIKKQLRDARIDAQDEIHPKLAELTALLEERLAAARLAANTDPYSDESRAEIARLKEATITEEQMALLAKKNNLESLVGLNLLNKLGILLIILGVIAASRYSYVRLPDLLKGIMMFLLGGVMLAGGELLNRKKANVFSLGITAGGVAVLYIALSVSYFGLKIMSMYPALALCILITATAFLLSTRYRSQTILAFALIGGYLPIFSISGDSVVLYGAVVYFITLNLLALSISFGRKWTASSFIGLGLNIVGTLCVCFNFYLRGTPLDKALSIGYVVFAFLVYTFIPILGTYREKSRFKTADVVIIAINTFFSSVMMYSLFYGFGMGDFDGSLTIFFALVYLLLGRLLETKFTGEKNVTGLFYLTGFAFVVLTVPLQLGVSWLSMGWLVEGVALLVYGILQKEKLFEQAGLIVSGLCLVSFTLFDVTGYTNAFFAYKYFAMTLGSLAILGALLHKKELRTLPQRVFKYGTIVNLWIYMQFVILHSLKMILVPAFARSAFDLYYLLTALAIIVTLLFAYGVSRIKPLADHVVKIIAIVLYVCGILQMMVLHLVASPYVGGITQSAGTVVVGTVILVGVSLLSMLALNDLLRVFVLDKTLPVAFYPLILSGYFVVLLTQTLVFQYGLYFSSAIISIIYVVTALAWTVLGFLRRYSFLRRFGLGLAILAVVKLFLIDLYALTQGYKIVSYFVLGVTLIAISFVYQYFNKRLEKTVGAVRDDQAD